MAKIALSEMVQELRRELQSGVQKGEGQDIRFRLGEVTIEVQVEVSREGGGGGKLSFWVAEVGADGQAAKTETQKITLTLQPSTANKEDVILNR